MPQQVSANNLAQGMLYSDLRNELHGRVSGETSTEMELFFKQDPKLETRIPSMNHSHEVVMTADGYALLFRYVLKNIRKKQTTTVKVPQTVMVGTEQTELVQEKKGWFTFKKVKKLINTPVYEEVERDVSTSKIAVVGQELVKEFWLAGVNDEHYYFVHRLSGIPEEKTRDMESVLAWVNRTDQGFLKRLQGDLVIMYVPYNAVTDSGTTLDIAKPQLTSTDSDDGEAKTQVALGSHVISPISGNVEFNGISVFDDTYVLVGGTGVLIQHGQHGLLEHSFPKGHYGLITGQRGRTLSVEKNTGFD